MKLSSQVVTENIELLMELLPLRTQWIPEYTFHKLGGITLLVQLIAMAPGWSNYPGKSVSPVSLSLLLQNANISLF